MDDILKKFDKSIDLCRQKGNYNINIGMLIQYIIEKLNLNSSTESSIRELESVLIKLFEKGYDTTVKIFCYYIISNFNQEFDEEFFTNLSTSITSDAVSLDKFDFNINALRNFMCLGQKDLVANISNIENLIKSTKYDLNFIVNAFYFSNYPILLLNSVNKISPEDLRQFKDFLSRFYLEFGKLMFFNKLQDGAFLNLIKMLSRILNNFRCFPVLSTKERITNSILIPLAEYLVLNLDEVVNLVKTFDNKLLVQAINLPMDLYKIYNFYRDPNNPNKRYEKNFHTYISHLFQELRNVEDPDIYSEVNKTICEFKILEKRINPGYYSTEIVENISKFINFSEHLDKSMWFDNNIKNLSHLINYVDNTEVIDLIILLLNETKYIKNYNDRIITLYNLFNRLITLSLGYGNFVEKGKESLISCLFEQEWFADLIKTGKLDEQQNRWRHDIFICLIEASFNSKKYLLQTQQILEYINLMKICQDIIDLCSKMLDWNDEGEAFKMYFLLIEETCIFFNDNFYNYVFNKNPLFVQMKKRQDEILDQISKRFSKGTQWDQLNFANEDSKYYSLLLLSKYLTSERTNDFNNLLDSIFRHLKEMTFDSKNGYQVEKLLKCVIILAKRLNTAYKERIIICITQVNEILKSKMETGDKTILTNILGLSEKILAYLYNHKNDNPIMMSNKTLEQINNDYYLVVIKDIDNNLETKPLHYNNLFLVNLTENSFDVMESYTNDNTSVYLEYFKNYYYYPLIEFNNGNCHMLIDTKKKYITSEWKLITGISDPVHVYYRYKTNIETREIELFFKCYNTLSIVLNNVYFYVYLNENLVEINKKTIGDMFNLNTFFNGIEHKTELLSPYSSYEFNIKCYSQIFDINYISIETQFDMNIDQKKQFTLKSEPFHIPLSDFLIADNYSAYEIPKFDMFYNTLEYVFSITCHVNCPPEMIIKSISDKMALIEFNSNNVSFRKEKEKINQIIKKQFQDYYQNFVVTEETIQKQQMINNQMDKIYFKIKLASYCVYNFWVYIFITGEYDLKINQSVLNTDIRTNDLKGLNVIAKEKETFIRELLNNKIVIY